MYTGTCIGTAVADEYYKLLLWCEHRNGSNSVAAEVIFMKHVNNGSVSSTCMPPKQEWQMNTTAQDKAI